MHTKEELTAKIDEANELIESLRSRAAKAIARVEVLKEQVTKDEAKLKEMGIDTTHLSETIEALQTEIEDGQTQIERVLSSLEEEVQQLESAIATAGGSG